FLNNHRRSFGWLITIAVVFAILPADTAAQTNQQTSQPNQQSAVVNYLDPVSGKTVDELVSLALANNAELIAMRKEAEAGEALLKQAGLRANPSLEVSGAKRIGATDNNLMIQGSQPLELGGRRTARIRVAEQELEIRKKAVDERERQLAAAVRSK